MATLQEIVTSARATRADNGVDPKQMVDGILYARNRAFHVAQANADAISRLARVKLELRNEAAHGVDAEFVLQLQLKVDRETHNQGDRELEKVIANSERQLSNEASSPRLRKNRHGNAPEASRIRGAAGQTPCHALTPIPCGLGFPGSNRVVRDPGFHDDRRAPRNAARTSRGGGRANSRHGSSWPHMDLRSGRRASMFRSCWRRSPFRSSCSRWVLRCARRWVAVIYVGRTMYS